MFCPNCGAEMQEGARFCPKCGKELKLPSGGATPVETVKTENTESTVNAASTVNTSTAMPPVGADVTAKLKSLPLAKIFAAAVGVLVVLFIVVSIVTADPKIDLDKYVVIETEGYDGYGTARAHIDWEQVESKYGKKLKYRKKAKKEYGNLLTLLTPMDCMDEAIEVKLENDRELTNGDEISYSFKIDEELEEVVTCKLKYKDKSKHKVEGLTEIGRFDPFEELEVEFTGTAPEGRVDYEYSGDFVSTYSFNCDKSSGLRNGDVVTISLDAGDMSYYAKNFGKIPVTTSKEYTVSGLEEYVSQYADLTPEFIEEVKKEAEDTFLAYTAGSNGRNYTFSDFEYAGYIFDAIKDTDTYFRSYNYLYLVYKSTVTNEEKEYEPKTLYFSLFFSDILKSDEGITYGEKGDLLGYTYFDSWNGISAHENLFDLYQDVTNSESFTSESGDGLEVFEGYKLVESLSDVSDSARSKLYEDAKKTIEAYIADDYTDGVVSNLKTEGEYLLIAKEESRDFEDNNCIMIVYSATVSSSGGHYDDTVIYYPVKLCGLAKLSNGDLVYKLNDGIYGQTSMGDSWYYTKGYDDGEEMYSSIITAHRDSFTYEVSDSLKKFGE